MIYEVANKDKHEDCRLADSRLDCIVYGIMVYYQYRFIIPDRSGFSVTNKGTTSKLQIETYSLYNCVGKNINVSTT